MFNAFTLHKWVFKKLCPGVKYKYDYPAFIRAVATHFIVRKPACDPYRTPLKRVRTLSSTKTGPGGEVRVCDLSKSTVCPGGDLEKSAKVNKRGRVVSLKCKYCWNGRSPVRVRRESVYVCSLCKVPLCVTCNYKYHQWLKFSDNV